MNFEIVKFSDRYAKFFTSLNMAWVEKYFVVESMDRKMLSEPKKYIIDKGGYIFFAKVDGNIAGTFALIKVEEGIYELSKMAVDDHLIGKKIGNRMLEFCMDEAKRLKADKIILYSNTKLQPAIHLYKKFGFKEVPLDHTEYERANIKMEIDFHG
jgi:N-acetylglutamate synthase-like GNAT family acetyltransferase